MFRDKKFTIPFIAEVVMPWLILIPGIMAAECFSASSRAYNNGHPTPEYYRAEELFDLLYALAMGGGVFILFVECTIGLVGLIWMIVNICKQNKEPFCIIKPLVLWLCPFVFNFGTLLLMLFVQGITYGQGI